MTFKNTMALAWLLFSILILVFDKRAGGAISPLMYTAIICTNVWAAS